MAAVPGLFVVGANDANGNATGVTSPRDARLALASLLSGPGLLSGGAVTGNSSGPDIQYDIAAGAFVTARGVQATDGLYLWTNNGTATENSADSATGNGGPAPASGSRYDLIWARAKNAAAGDGFSDADSLPEFGVTAGASGSSPQKPYSSVPAGALVLAESLVASGEASGASAQITMVAPFTVAAGSPVPVRSSAERDALTAYTGLRVSRLDAGELIQTYNGSAWLPSTTWTNLYIPAGAMANSFGYTPQYKLYPDGRVDLRGNLAKSSGAWATGATVLYSATWDAAIRPASLVEFPVATTAGGSANSDTARFEINPNGTGTLYCGGTTGPSWISFDGISYYRS